MRDKTPTRRWQEPTAAPPSGSTQVIRVEDLGNLIHQKRQREGLTLEQAAHQSGVSAATLSRWERQRRAGVEGDKPRATPDVRTLTAVTRWLGVSLDRVVEGEPQTSAQEIAHRENDTTPDIVATHLRADRNLDSRTAAALTDLFRAAYAHFAQLSNPPPTTGASDEREHG